MKKHILSLLLLTGLAASASNEPLSPVPPSQFSPASASIGEYGAMPVNLFSGTPSVEIPLVTLNTGGNHTWPVSLIYTSGGGVKPAQSSGIVGLGWALKSAGMITRIKHGAPDESYLFNEPPSWVNDSIIGWYYRHNYADITWDNAASLKSKMEEYISGDQILYDLEPDVFNFSFSDCQGSFYMGEDGEWKIKCNRDIRVEFGGDPSDFIDMYRAIGIDHTDGADILQLQTGYSKSFRRFTLIDEQGTRYTFGGDVSSIEYSAPFFAGKGDRIVANAWHLTKIEYMDGRKVTFRYMTDRPYIAQMTFNRYSYDLHTIHTNGSWGSKCSTYTEGPSFDGNLIMPVYLTDIISDEDAVTLKYDDNESEYYDFTELCGYRITMYEPDEEKFLPFLIDYGIRHRFNDWYYPGCLEAVQRKKLTALEYRNFQETAYSMVFEYDQSRHLILKSVYNDATGGMYGFQYYRPEKLPVFSLKGVDAWGYYKDTNYATAEGECLKYGILSKVTYPTGGYTRFDYERHSYSMAVTELRGGVVYNDNDKFAGGVRVKRIYQSPTGNDSDEYVAKEYSYIQSYATFKDSPVSLQRSSGCLLQPEIYSYAYTLTSIDGSRHSVSFYTDCSMSNRDDSGSEGHIGYSEVAEKNADGSVTVYKFTNYDTNPDERPVVEIQELCSIKPCSHRSQERGLLKEKYQYLSSGKIWKETSFTYHPDKNIEDSYTKCLNISGKQLCREHDGSRFYDGVAYKRYYYVMRPVKISEKEYDDRGGSFTTTTDITYVPGFKGLIRSRVVSYGDRKDYTTLSYGFESAASNKRGLNILLPLSKEEHSIRPFFVSSVQQTPEVVGRTKYEYEHDSFLPTCIEKSGFAGEPYQKTQFTYGLYNVVEKEAFLGKPDNNYVWNSNASRVIATYPGPHAGNTSGQTSVSALLAGRDYYRYEYDSHGRLIRSIKGEGLVPVDYTYDDGGRLVGESIDGKTVRTYIYHYANVPQGFNQPYGVGYSDGTYKATIVPSVHNDPDQTIEYMDGFGRKVQTVLAYYGQEAEDNILTVAYDRMGLVSRSYVPVALEGENCQSISEEEVLQWAEMYYDDAEYAYTEYSYDSRDDHRLVREILPGSAWHSSNGKTISYSFVMNPGRYPMCDRDSGLIWHSDVYAPGELRMTETVDEDGKKSREIRNRHDLVVRTVMCTESGDLITDYVYDEKDNLRYVLPPGVVNAIKDMPDGTKLDRLEQMDMCYVYTYDVRNRLATKKLPHCNMETFYYDDNNLLRLSQSASQSSGGEWSFHHYDDLCRQVYKYNFHPALSPALLAQNIARNIGAENVPFDPDAAGDVYGYPSFNDLLGISPDDGNSGEIEWVNYYDGVTPGAVLPEYADSMAYRHYPEAEMPVEFRGELSGQLVRVAADSSFIVSAVYYDHLGRIIQEVSSNILGGYDRKMTSYHSCLSVPKQNVEIHSTSKECHMDIYDYEYGWWDRLMRLSMTHDDEPVKELLSNTYDALGRLASQTVCGVSTTDYTYHLHGGISTAVNPYFSQKLYYEKGPDSSAGYLNGNISSYHWSASADGTGPSTLWRSYTYSYDGADRLTSAVYGESGSRHDDIFVNSPDYSEYRSYDLNSNLLSLKTYGLTDRQKLTNGTSLSFGVIKDIRFDNVGSQMLAATIAPTSSTVSTMDNSVIGALKEETTFGFSYDAAGNLTSDGLRRQTFEYDRFGHLSYALPESGKKTSSIANYTYDASGRLHKRMMEIEQLKADLQLPLQPSLPDSLITITPVFPKDSIKLFSGTAPASKAASLPGILWPPVSDRDSMTAIQAFTIQTPYEYCGNYEYIRGKLSRINTPTGYYENGRHYFYVKDYQGNVRCTVADNDSLTKAVHYYPGGSLFGESYGYYFWSGNNLFQGGKLEKSDAHTFYDLQNRHYDPILNRFTSVDALGEKSRRVSHYIYGLGNPIRFIDPLGLEPKPYEGALMSWAVYQDKNFVDIIKILENLNWYISNKDFNIQMNHPANTGIGMQSMVFEKRKGDEVIEYAYVYAGTNSLEDVVEDITQTIGFSPQVNAAVKNAKIMEDNVDGKELTFLGHSLGGSLAAASSMATGKKAITYNPAAISRASRLLHGLIDDNKIVNYISVGINFMGRSATIDPITYIQNELGIYAPGMNYCVQVGLQWPWNYHSIEVLTKALK